jgi:hypothetical protein
MVILMVELTDDPEIDVISIESRLPDYSIDDVRRCSMPGCEDRVRKVREIYVHSRADQQTLVRMLKDMGVSSSYRTYTSMNDQTAKLVSAVNSYLLLIGHPDTRVSGYEETHHAVSLSVCEAHDATIDKLTRRLTALDQGSSIDYCLLGRVVEDADKLGKQ